MLCNASNPKRVRELFPEAQYLPAGSDPVYSVVQTEPSAVRPGDLYVHLDEFDSSGAEVASARGASVVVAERLLPDVASTLVIVDDCRTAHHRLAAETPSAPMAGLPLITVGGASGTSHTATLLAGIYATAGHSVGLMTDTLEDDGEHCQPRGAQTKEAKSRFSRDQWLLRCRLGGISAVVYQAETTRSAIGPAKVACLTSLRCDGLDDAGLRAWDSVAHEQAARIASLGGLNASNAVVANADDPDCLRLAAEHTGSVITFGESSAADLRVTPVESHTNGQTFLVTNGADSACVAIPTPGRAARRNVAAAIASAVAVGFDLRSAVKGVDLASRPLGSLEPISCGQGFSVSLDESMRPLAIGDALEGARSAGGRLYAVIRLSEQKAVADWQLAVASRMADRVFAHGGAIDRCEAPEGVTCVEDRMTAFAVALGLADDGDAVLLGGSRDNEQDRQAAASLLRRRLACEDRRAAA